MKECSAKYQAAKTAGTLGGQKWNDFRKTQCGTHAGAAPAGTDDRENSRGAASFQEPSLPNRRVAEVLG
jgi:hypothetical protein